MLQLSKMPKTTNIWNHWLGQLCYVWRVSWVDVTPDVVRHLAEEMVYDQLSHICEPLAKASPLRFAMDFSMVRLKKIHGLTGAPIHSEKKKRGKKTHLCNFERLIPICVQMHHTWN